MENIGNWNGMEQKRKSGYIHGSGSRRKCKTVPLTGVSARYLKLQIMKSRRNYFASHELPVYKKDGSKPFAVGSTNKNETVSEGDYTNMKKLPWNFCQGWFQLCGSNPEAKWRYQYERHL